MTPTTPAPRARERLLNGLAVALDSPVGMLMARQEIDAIEAEAVAAERARLREAVEDLTVFDWKLGDLDLISLPAVLALLGEPQ